MTVIASKRAGEDLQAQVKKYHGAIRLFVAAVLGMMLMRILQPKGGTASVGSSSTPTTDRRLIDSTWHHDVEDFLKDFKAAKPEWTDKCKAYLRSPALYNQDRESFINYKWEFSQYNQDWFMLVNFFLDQAKSGKKGFYVESGANNAIRVSNTAFLDLCLGWSGICVEPTARYHQGLRNQRTCKLVTNCLSDVNETVKLAGEVAGGDKGVSIDCVRLDDVLRQEGVETVDLWSLDIEGFEPKALAGMDFDRVNVRSILMEQNDVGDDGSSKACHQFPIDYRLTTMGYRKYRIVSDGFYIKGGSSSLQERFEMLQFPDPKALDRYFFQLERRRCEQAGTFLSIFKDDPRAEVQAMNEARRQRELLARRSAA